MNKFRRDQVIAWGYKHHCQDEVWRPRRRRLRTVIFRADDGFELANWGDRSDRYDGLAHWNWTPRRETLDSVPDVRHVGIDRPAVGEVYEIPSIHFSERAARFRVVGIGDLALPDGRVIREAIIGQLHLWDIAEEFLVFRPEDWRIYDTEEGWRELCRFEERQERLWLI